MVVSLTSGESRSIGLVVPSSVLARPSRPVSPVACPAPGSLVFSPFVLPPPPGHHAGGGVGVSLPSSSTSLGSCCGVNSCVRFACADVVWARRAFSHVGAHPVGQCRRSLSGRASARCLGQPLHVSNVVPRCRPQCIGRSVCGSVSSLSGCSVVVAQAVAPSYVSNRSSSDLGLVGSSACPAAIGSASVGRSHFGSIGRRPALVAGGVFRFGCASAVSRPKGQNSSSLSGPLPLRRTSSGSVGAGGSAVISEASLAPSSPFLRRLLAVVGLWSINVSVVGISVVGLSMK